MSSARPEQPVDSGGPREARFALTPTEELQLQQLLQLRTWSERAAHSSPPSESYVPESSSSPTALPARWDLTMGLTLRDWQRDCVDAWFRNGRRGVLKVVTGAGKTILALAIAERLQQKEAPELRVAIVVPTQVLAAQWQDELKSRSNLPPASVGLLGAGSRDGFDPHVRVLVCVLASASKRLAEEVGRAGVGSQLLLIVDECHRAGAREMQQVFQTSRAYSLGLSATPEREEPDDDDRADDDDLVGSVPFEESVVGRELGSVIYELSYAAAIEREILPPFKVVHYGLSLSPAERAKYDKLSQEIRELRSELETSKRRGLALMRWARSKSGSDSRAARLVALTTERKQLLFHITERQTAVLSILREAFARSPDTKAILFHESIDEVMHLFCALRSAGYAVVAEHSEFPDGLRAESLRLFRKGIANVVVSARSLIEGFNVPAADIGIVVAATSSVRQRVQTLGRLLRRSQRSDGTEKTAALFVLYASETADEFIYEKADWDSFIGASRNEYYRWADVAQASPVAQAGPPRTPKVAEVAIDPLALTPGGEYPGDPSEGVIYSLDSQGTVSDEDGAPVEPHEQLRAMLARMPRGGGRFRVTPKNRYVVRLEKVPEGWRAIYLGHLDSDLRLASSANAEVENLTPGAPYPLGLVRGKTYSLLQRDKRLIAEKGPGRRVRFVVPLIEIADEMKRQQLRALQEFLAGLPSRGHRPNKITVTPRGHVVYLFENHAYFAGLAPEGADGFVLEDSQ